MKIIFYDNKIKSFDELIAKTINDLSGYLNSIKIKSLILYYNHDLENRTSYNFTHKENSLYIDYNYENKNFNKDVFFQMIGIMLNYDNLKIIIENNYNSNKEFKEFLKFLNYISEDNFMELFFLFIFSSLKYEMLKNNKFNFSLFNMNNPFCDINSKAEAEKAFDSHQITENDLKRYKDYKFNICKCNDEDIYNKNNNFNLVQKFNLDKIKTNLEDKCQKILLIEMENFRNHLGIF